MKPELIREVLDDFLAEAKVEGNDGLVRNVALLGPQSRNGYRYAAEAMQEAAPLYDGRPVFVDHPQGSTPTERKLRDYAGKVLNPRFENERILGDLQLLGPNASWLMGLIESSPSDIGMSHVVLARRGKDEVEHIEKVVSVDIVAFPATTKTFLEGAKDIGQEFVADSLPIKLRTPEFLQRIQETPNPSQFVELLNTFFKEQLTEPPRSAERRMPATWGKATSSVAKQAIIHAIRGSL